MSDSDVEKSPVSTKRAREASFEDQATEQVPLDPQDQTKLISQLQEQQLKDGESWCLISKAWYDSWTKYCARMSNPDTRSIGEKTHPGPIRNQSLYKNGQIAEDLVYNQNVYAVPMSAWNQLVKWYGVHEESQDPIERQVISTTNGLTVELYPPQFRLYSIEHEETSFISNLERCPVITLSQSSLIKDFLHAVREAFDLTPNTEIQAWILKESPVVSKLPNISVINLSQATLLDTDDQDAILSLSGKFNLAIETKLEKFPSESLTKNDSSSVSSTSSVFANGFNNLSTSTPPPSLIVTPKFARGVCGLQNLGNTCFMNSALQCLSNTPQLTKYFLANFYKRDLNRENPLGMKGQVAEEYGELIKKLWSGQSSSIAPRDFKYTLGRFNTSFSGYQQHDTQELLAFLLDGLHEDLNRIIEKPYVQLPDFDGLTDTEIAKRSWEYHSARNASIIVDLFQGQFKSRLICNQCKNVSVTFDPFMYLSLPLPIKKQSKTSIIYVPYDPSQQMQRMVVTLSKDASIAHLQKEVARMMSVEDPTSLLVVEIFSHKIYKVMPLYEPVATIGSSDIIYVYQLPGPVPPVPKRSFGYSQPTEPVAVDENQLIVFPVYCATVSTNESSYNCDRVTQFGEPIVLAVPYKDANKPDLLYKLVSQHIERYTQFKLFEEIKESFTTEELSSDTVVENGQPMDEEPPQYETIMNKDTNQDMDIDVQPQLIHTAAAVLPAGGKKIEPMSNLFAMKVFSATRSYSRDGEELLPTTQNWTNLIDLRERAEQEYLQRQEYFKQQEESNQTEKNSVDDSDMGEPTANSIGLNSELQESVILPSEMEDDEDDEDDIVEDAAASYAQDGINNDTMDDILQDPPYYTQPLEELKDEDETDDLDSIQNNSNHLSDTDSDSQFLATTVSNPTPVINQPQFTNLPKRKVTLPPSTIIRQGEGILLEWTVKKAQQLFGTPRSFGDENAVNTEAWEDMNDLGDPNLETDQTNQPKQITLSDCLNEFTKEEELSEEDLWYCPKCKKHQRATKKFDLWRMPEITVVHLKRFSHSRTWRDKIDVLIDFPITELDLTDRVMSIEERQNIKDEDRLIYDLYAVDNHFGGLGGGHCKYTAYAQNFEDGNWYNFDDSHVTKVNVATVKKTKKQQAAEEANIFAPTTELSSLDDNPHQPIGEDQPITEFSQDFSDMI
ncbi:hypothetical protein INT48_006131 [Thamnidium elegans]|uniref:ubiquitinyl hydrolase 1 n=1 Tax=Thamnidium elegans TaxID=101142 RepID=A0A8H7SX78_9FUNG|nr:hypothetical protein INT48_006131 [Thamnidium elegans]